MPDNQCFRKFLKITCFLGEKTNSWRKPSNFDGSKNQSVSKTGGMMTLCHKWWWSMGGQNEIVVPASWTDMEVYTYFCEKSLWKICTEELKYVYLQYLSCRMCLFRQHRERARPMWRTYAAYKGLHIWKRRLSRALLLILQKRRKLFDYNQGAWQR